MGNHHCTILRDKTMTRLRSLSCSSGSNITEVVNDAILVAGDYIQHEKDGQVLEAAFYPVLEPMFTCSLDERVSRYVPYKQAEGQRQVSNIHIYDGTEQAMDAVVEFIEATTNTEAFVFAVGVLDLLARFKSIRGKDPSEKLKFRFVNPENSIRALYIIPYQGDVFNQGQFSLF